MTRVGCRVDVDSDDNVDDGRVEVGGRVDVVECDYARIVTLVLLQTHTRRWNKTHLESALSTSALQPSTLSTLSPYTLPPMASTVPTPTVDSDDPPLESAFS